jgi:hypothetical protein
MKLAIMQPYFFPYLGYYQLAATVDRFVFLDDVAYQRGWMNRNRLLISGQVRYFTVPLSGASQNLAIDRIKVDANPVWRNKMIRSFVQSYRKAPYFESAFEIFSQTLGSESELLADFAKQSVRLVAAYLGLKTQFIDSSRRYGNTWLVCEQRILDIVQREQATEYYNLPGGRDLYCPETFLASDIALRFIAPNLRPYPQFTAAFTPALSILDVLAFNSKESVRELLGVSTFAMQGAA